ncbi:uncharacterized protein LOC110460493 [Mizuhopecten yessoensis]|uniref:Mitochondria-eating protein C-terminal domain-containing protein n=1 Tax=Mizuhopecten yessoensis TaxID=6573 RepID=A0A210Q2B8_MIZYE|nr:uncharacterized protein LOC110460493 [Mizuhopecten yessoensis]OWF42898.1 hypothetical protein KP79_PYT17641 [Mizuhopecten yessoensis]
MQFNKLVASPRDQYRAVVVERTTFPPCSDCQRLRLENTKLRMALEKSGYRDPNRQYQETVVRTIIPAMPKQGATSTPFRTPREPSPMTNARVTDWETIWAGTPDLITARAQPSKMSIRPGQDPPDNTEALYKEIARLSKELDYRISEAHLCRRRLGEATPNTSGSRGDVFASSRNRAGKEQLTDDKEKVGRLYSKMFVNEWEAALQVLETSGREYRKCTELLFSILVEIYKYSERKSAEQLSKIIEGTNDVLMQSTGGRPLSRYNVKAVGGIEAMIYRRKVSDSTVAAITQLYTVNNVEEFQKQNITQTIKNNKKIKDYVSKCVEVTWCMCIQDPAMNFDLTRKKGYAFDLSRYQYYRTEGTIMDSLVWPVLLSRAQGAVVSKGWADAEPKKPKKGGASKAETANGSRVDSVK